jgi:hypothetical protein
VHCTHGSELRAVPGEVQEEVGLVLIGRTPRSGLSFGGSRDVTYGDLVRGDKALLGWEAALDARYGVRGRAERRFLSYLGELCAGPGS